MPLFRSFDAPLRNVNVTVPEVVGVHLKVVDCPAVIMKPGGIIGGLAVEVSAATAASKQATAASGAKCIMMLICFNPQSAD